jgi:hypothetical protein
MVKTTLGTPVILGAKSFEVASVANITVGQSLTLEPPNSETAKVASISGLKVETSAPLRYAHARGCSVSAP